MNQIELFTEQLPGKPWCSDDEHGAWPRVLTKRAAMRRRYIQPQPPWLRVWVVFDYDHDGAWCAADEAGLPVPTWAAINRQNGHGHLAYGIDTPVRLKRWNGRRGPANYLNQYHLPVPIVGVGRNVETFDHVRKWAYRVVLSQAIRG